MLDVSVCPTCAVPEITGGDTSDGAAISDTTAVCADVTVADPYLFDAVTLTRSVAPTSADPARYVCAVAPASEAHALPAESHRSHW